MSDKEISRLTEEVKEWKLNAESNNDLWKQAEADRTRLLKTQNELIEWLQEEIDKIENDDRHHYAPALVQVNAPLALIQVGLETRKQALQQMKKILSID